MLNKTVVRGAVAAAGCGVAVLLGGCASSESGSAVANEGVPVETGALAAESSSVLLVVEGLSCPMCASNIDRELAQVPGVTDVSVDLNSGTVTVALARAPRPSAADFEKAVYDSGFTLKRIATP